ncbi:MAG: hypothetical protein ABW179_06675 [Methylobacterium sp.]
MPLTVTYAIHDETDGRFSVVAEMAPDRIYRREGLATLAEAEAWIEGLQVLMAACGAPVVRAVADTPRTAPTDVDRVHPHSFSK